MPEPPRRGWLGATRGCRRDLLPAVLLEAGVRFGFVDLQRPGLNRVEARVLRWPFAGAASEWVSSQVPRSAQADLRFSSGPSRVALDLVSSQLPCGVQAGPREIFGSLFGVIFRLGFSELSAQRRGRPRVLFRALSSVVVSWTSSRFPRSAGDGRTGSQKPELFTRTAR
jgi:hypothetical protein